MNCRLVRSSFKVKAHFRQLLESSMGRRRGLRIYDYQENSFCLKPPVEELPMNCDPDHQDTAFCERGHPFRNNKYQCPIPATIKCASLRLSERDHLLLGSTVCKTSGAR
jgi:hypothetical protein